MEKQTILITGANRGLGLTLAEEFSETHKLILHTRQDGQCLSWISNNSVIIEGDLRNFNTISRLVKTSEELGLDILINNAGVYLQGDFETLPHEKINYTIDVNLVAPIMLTRGLWPIFVKKQSGMVINISSLAVTSPGPGESVYAATKAGLTGFSDGLQFDATNNGIRVINLLLGSMQTGMTSGRPNQELMIETGEVSQVIRALCEEHCSLRITNLEIKRRNY